MTSHDTARCSSLILRKEGHYNCPKREGCLRYEYFLADKTTPPEADVYYIAATVGCGERLTHSCGS